MSLSLLLFSVFTQTCLLDTWVAPVMPGEHLQTTCSVFLSAEPLASPPLQWGHSWASPGFSQVWFSCLILNVDLYLAPNQHLLRTTVQQDLKSVYWSQVTLDPFVKKLATHSSARDTDFFNFQLLKWWRDKRKLRRGTVPPPHMSIMISARQQWVVAWSETLIPWPGTEPG